MKHKKLFAILTLVCFMFTLMPAAAMAEGETAPLPNCVITPLGAIEPESHYIIGMYGTGDNQGSMPLNFAVLYEASSDDEETNYDDWYTDFYLKVEGLTTTWQALGYENGHFEATENCYLAGYNKTLAEWFLPEESAWVKIPLDDIVVQEGVEYPVVSPLFGGVKLQYDDIRNIIKAFTCGAYLEPEIIKAYPNMKIILTLRLTDPDDETVVDLVQPCVYDASTGNTSQMITLDKAAISMSAGSTVQLNANTKEDVEWQSLNDDVANVDEDGLVTGKTKGRTLIRATAGGNTATCEVVVNNVLVTGVTLEEAAEIKIGETVTLTAAVAPANATNKDVTWTSSDTTIATVDATGKVTGESAGTATITATTVDGGKTATCVVTVTDPEPVIVPVTGVTLDKTTAEVAVNNTVQLTATVAPENATDKTVTWTSSDETIATVADGVVTALKAGTVTITAASGEATATCEVTVKAKSSGYYGGGYVSSTSVSIASDDNATVKVSDKYADKGETVTITVDAKDGYYAKDVVVTDKNGEAITVTRVALDKWTFTMPSGKVKVDVDTAEYSKEVVLQIGDLDIAVNDAVIQSDVAPFIKNDRTMVPISVIVYALGGTTDWDGETRTVTVTLDGKVLTMVIDEIIPGFGAAAIIVDSRTYVPIGYVADVLGCDVDWIAATRQVVIVK